MNRNHYKRIGDYLNERFPVIPRLLLGYIFFFEISYIIIHLPYLVFYYGYE